MPPKKQPRKGDIVYYRDKGEIKECIVVEVSKDHRSFGMCMLEICDGTGDIVIANASELCDVSEMMRQQEEINSTINSIWQDKYDMYHTVETDSYGVGIEEWEPPENNCDDNDQTEYEILYNALGSVGSILMTLIEFANSGKKLGNTALLALRDKAELLDANDVVKAIDSYLVEKDADDDLGYDPDR